MQAHTLLVLESCENAHSVESCHVQGGSGGGAGGRLHKAGLERWRGHVRAGDTCLLDGRWEPALSCFPDLFPHPFQAILNPAATVTLQKPQVCSFPSCVRDVSHHGCFIQKFSIHSPRNPPSLSWLVWLLSATSTRRVSGEVFGKLG